MSKKLSSLLTTLLVVLAITSTAMAQQRRSFQSQSSTNRGQADAAAVFRSARDMITDGEWAKAQQKFSEYVSSYPNEKNLDAALYWLAYSQQKLKNFDDCKKTINQLLEKYPESSWRDDARVLLVQVPGSYVIAPGETPKPIRASRAYVIEPGQTPKPARAPVDVDVAIAPGEPVVVYKGDVVSTIPAVAPVAIAQGVGIGVGGGIANVWSVDDLESSNDDDPCEFKIVVLQALFQTDAL